MGERLLCKQEVIGSIPFTSTTIYPVGRRYGAAMTVRRDCFGSGEATICRLNLGYVGLFFDMVKSGVSEETSADVV